MATRVKDPRIRSDLEVLAKKWRQLAADREKFPKVPDSQGDKGPADRNATNHPVAEPLPAARLLSRPAYGVLIDHEPCRIFP
jgi:hypothetical protein